MFARPHSELLSATGIANGTSGLTESSLPASTPNCPLKTPAKRAQKKRRLRQNLSAPHPHHLFLKTTCRKYSTKKLSYPNEKSEEKENSKLRVKIIRRGILLDNETKNSRAEFTYQRFAILHIIFAEGI
jgi:hypothetical protein